MNISPSLPYKILVISDYRSPGPARPEAEIFVRLAQQGHQVFILSYPEASYYNDRFRSFGINVIENHPTRKISFSFIRFLKNFIHQHDIDVVHVFNSKGLTNAVWALQGLKTKLIAYRGYAGQTHWYDPAMYLKYFHPRVDHIICNDENVYDSFAEESKRIAKKCSVIYKGHDPAWYMQTIKADRNQLGFKENDVLVCFVANVRPFKGLTWLLQATHLLPKEINWQFLFIGQGYDEPTVKAEMESSPLRNNLHCLGYRKDANSIVAASDCLVLTSTHGESLNKSVIEAMCLGLAPIITDIPGNSRLVEDGESGWKIPIKDPNATANALIEMAKDPAERKRRGKNAVLRIQEHFHIDLTVKKYLALYQQLVNEV